MKYIGKITLSLLLSTICMFFVRAEAAPCNQLKYPPFGKTMAELKRDMGISDTGVQNTDFYILLDRGKAICPLLPSNSELELWFIDKRLSALKIQVGNKSADKLLQIAEDSFGKLEKKPNKGHPGSGSFQHIWDKNGWYAIYVKGDLLDGATLSIRKKGLKIPSSVLKRRGVEK